MTDEDRPMSAADPRPNDEPYYIDNECPDCGTDLMLYDMVSDEQMRESDALADPDYIPEESEDIIWYDEWVCPNCLNGIHMDWPEWKKDDVFGRMENLDEDDFMSIEEVEEELGLATKKDITDAFRSNGEDDTNE